MLASTFKHYLSDNASSFAKVPDLGRASIRLCPTLKGLPVPGPQSGSSAFHLDHPDLSIFRGENVYRSVGCSASAAVPPFVPQLLQHLVFSASASRIGGGDHVQAGGGQWL